MMIGYWYSLFEDGASVIQDVGDGRVMVLWYLDDVSIDVLLGC